MSGQGGVKPPNPLQKLAGGLPFVQLALVLGMAFVAWQTPFVLKVEPMWLGPSTASYARNPLVGWLALGQFLCIFPWVAIAAPKPLWQWVLVLAALAASAVVWLAFGNPPPYLG